MLAGVPVRSLPHLLVAIILGHGTRVYLNENHRYRLRSRVLESLASRDRQGLLAFAQEVRFATKQEKNQWTSEPAVFPHPTPAQVPATWAKRAWPSLRPLGSWLNDFTSRLSQLEEWQNNPAEVSRWNPN